MQDADAAALMMRNCCLPAAVSACRQYAGESAIWRLVSHVWRCSSVKSTSHAAISLMKPTTEPRVLRFLRFLFSGHSQRETQVGKHYVSVLLLHFASAAGTHLDVCQLSEETPHAFTRLGSRSSRNLEWCSQAGAACWLTA